MKYCFNLLNLLSGWVLLTPATEWGMVILELILYILRKPEKVPRLCSATEKQFYFCCSLDIQAEKG